MVNEAVKPRDVDARSVAVEIDRLTHWFVGAHEPQLVLDDVTVSIPSGQFVALVGPSGCGKTTILNSVAGLVTAVEGHADILLEGTKVEAPHPSVGYMLARDALLPWRNLQRNVEFGLEMRGFSRMERAALARDAIAMIGLAGNERKFPRQLSHGMRQRANLARLLVTRPRLLLMDEPFGALDAQTKAALQIEFSKLWEAERITVVFVTHDLAEAALLADRVLVMVEGRIVEDAVVPFDRPRDHSGLRQEPTFGRFVNDLWSLLGGPQ